MARRSGLSFAKKRRKLSGDTVRDVFNYILGIIFAAGLGLFLVYNWGIRTSVIGVSMENTLYNGQTIFISKLSYLVMKPKVGDIIVFKPNGNENTHYYVKRVVALPGDTVEFRDGRLYVNGIMEDEKHDKTADPGIAETPLVLGVDEYFVLGDNRNNGEDSRSGNIGPVKREIIAGRAWFKLSCKDSYFGFIGRD
ncbi:MAG: signal peptidase I [Lachnospiraceae bacterium]|nr:signal peptidase I [Lachnospiraceae bacterium]